MIGGSLFSGCGLMDLAMQKAGIRPAFQVEIDATCRKVLARHWPDVERHEDVRKFGRHATVHRPDVLWGGFPCTSLSVAGKRAGFAGESGLWFEFRRCIEEFAPAVVLIENVPGLLSGCGCPLCCCVADRIKQHLEHEKRQNPMARDCGCGECSIGRKLHQAHSGRNFQIVLSGLVQLGYGVASRILDAQYAGVPQRRRRVFIVGCLGSVASAAEILLEPDSVPWHPSPRRKAGTRVASAVTRSLGSGGPDAARAQANHLTHTHTHRI